MTDTNEAPTPDDLPALPPACADRDFSWVYTARQTFAYGRACWLAAIDSRRASLAAVPELIRDAPLPTRSATEAEPVSVSSDHAASATSGTGGSEPLGMKLRELLWGEHPECCGCPVVGAEYMGSQEMVCCGNPEPSMLNDAQIVASLRALFPDTGA